MSCVFSPVSVWACPPVMPTLSAQTANSLLSFPGGGRGMPTGTEDTKRGGEGQ